MVRAVAAVIAISSLVVVLPATLSVWTMPRLWVAALAALLGAIYQRRYSPMQARAWSVFGLCAVPSILTSIDPSMSIMGQWYCGAETVMLMLLCYLLMSNAVGVDDHVVAIAITIFGTIAAMYLVLQGMGINPLAWNAPASYNRMPGLMGHPAWSGLMAAMTIPFALYLSDYDDTWYLSIAVCVIGLVLTGSRGAIIAAVVSAVWHYRDRLPRTLAALLVAMSAIAVIYLGYHGSQSDVMRIEQNRLAMLAWWQHPWLGWGPGTGALWFLRVRDILTASRMGDSIVIQVHSHNWITNILASQGVIGLAGWAVMACYCWRTATDTVRGALLVVGIFGLFNPIPPVVYIVMAVAVGSCASGDERSTIARRSVMTLLAGVVFAVMSSSLASDVMARRGHHADRSSRYNDAARYFLRAAKFAPWEFYYPARAATSLPTDNDIRKAVARASIKSSRVHRYNPMSITASSVALQLIGRPKAAISIAKYALKLDPLRVLHTAK